MPAPVPGGRGEAERTGVGRGTPGEAAAWAGLTPVPQAGHYRHLVVSI